MLPDPLIFPYRQARKLSGGERVRIVPAPRYKYLRIRLVSAERVDRYLLSGPRIGVGFPAQPILRAPRYGRDDPDAVVPGPPDAGWVRTGDPEGGVVIGDPLRAQDGLEVIGRIEHVIHLYIGQLIQVLVEVRPAQFPVGAHQSQRPAVRAVSVMHGWNHVLPVPGAHSIVATYPPAHRDVTRADQPRGNPLPKPIPPAEQLTPRPDPMRIGPVGYRPADPPAVKLPVCQLLCIGCPVLFADSNSAQKDGLEIFKFTLDRWYQGLVRQDAGVFGAVFPAEANGVMLGKDPGTDPGGSGKLTKRHDAFPDLPVRRRPGSPADAPVGDVLHGKPRRPQRLINCFEDVALFCRRPGGCPIRPNETSDGTGENGPFLLGQLGRGTGFDPRGQPLQGRFQLRQFRKRQFHGQWKRIEDRGDSQQPRRRDVIHRDDVHAAGHPPGPAYRHGVGGVLRRQAAVDLIAQVVDEEHQAHQQRHRQQHYHHHLPAAAAQVRRRGRCEFPANNVFAGSTFHNPSCSPPGALRRS